MKEENLRRFIWTKDELKQLLVKDLEEQGIMGITERESALRLSSFHVILEVWGPSLHEMGRP
ncbi:MAG: hypothetical protein GTN76_09240 [Candidatus Aenigmarchaeota archaeon]|nr:hypothetical protein [Candidatus Aenigmarchaeota archaeon]